MAKGLEVWFTADLEHLLDAVEVAALDMPDAERVGAAKVLTAVRVALGLVQRGDRARVRVLDVAARVLPAVAVVVFALAGLTACGATDAEPPDVAAVRARATVQAVEFAADRAAADQARAMRQAEVWSWLAFAGQILVGVVAVGAVCVTLWNVETTVAARLRLSVVRHGLVAQVVETRAGTLTRDADLLPVGSVPDYDRPTDAALLPAPVPDTFRFNAGGSSVVLTKAPTEREADRRAVLRLLRLTVQKRGAGSDRLAGWRELNMSASTWTHAAALLKRYTVARSGRAGGTFLQGEYPTAGALYQAIGERRAALSPADDLPDQGANVRLEQTGTFGTEQRTNVTGAG